MINNRSSAHNTLLKSALLVFVMFVAVWFSGCGCDIFYLLLLGADVPVTVLDRPEHEGKNLRSARPAQDRTGAKGRSKSVSAQARAESGGGIGPTLAPFFGNLSAIAGYGGVGLVRGSGCSLTLDEVSGSVSPSQVTLTLQQQTPNYERIIHNNAFLTTTPDAFPAGCVDSTIGATSGLFVSLGLLGNGNYLGAGAGEEVYSGQIPPTGGAITPVSNTTPQPPASIMSGDLNKDGIQDMVSINTDGLTGSATVFLGNADGSFKPGVTLALPTEQVQFGVLDDVDGDGNLDLIVNTGNNTFSVFLGKGDGTFGSIQTVAPVGAQIFFTDRFISADVNGDHKKDLITSEGQVFLGAGDGSTFTLVAEPAFPRIIDTTNSYAPSIVAADFNKDGKMDLATDDGMVIRIYLGAGDGTFTAGSAYATIGNRGFIIATDLDGDGNLDLFSGFGSNGFYSADDFLIYDAYALMGNGDGTFQGAPSLGVQYNGSNLADLNGDGRPDLVGLVGSAQNTFQSYLTGANGVPVPGPTLAGPLNLGIDSYAVGDVSGDKVPDLVFLSAAPQAQSYYVAVGNGDGSFQTPTATPVPSLVPSGLDINPFISGLQLADFNHDGKLDLIYSFTDQDGATQIYTQGFAVQLGNGNGTFGAPIITTYYSSTDAPTSAPINAIDGVVDVTGDNFPDVFLMFPNGIVNGEAQSKALAYVGKGDGTFQSPNTLTLTPNVLSKAVANGSPLTFADLNHDGKMDLVTSGSDSTGMTPMIAISLGNGDGTFKTPTLLTFQGFGFVSATAVADFDGDGKLDIFLNNVTEGTGAGVLPGNGDGTFQTVSNGDGTVSPTELVEVSLGQGAVAVDLKNTGEQDVIAGGTVLLNKSGQTPPSMAATSTSLTAAPNPAAAGATVTLTATVTSTTAGTITGTVTFLDSGTSIGTGTVGAGGVATLMTSTLAAGSHSITASYGGDANYAGSTTPTAVTLVINGAGKASTNTAVASSLNPSTAGASVTFMATVSSTTAGTITGTVTFFDNETQIGTGTLSGGMATFMTSTLAAGSHSITAQYGGDANYAASTSSALTQTVNAATGDFSVAVTPGAVTVTAGNSGMVALTVTPSGGSTQTVTFACSGLPTGAACSFLPPSVTLDGTHAATSQVTITTTGPGKAARVASAGTLAGAGPRNGRMIASFGVGLLGIFGLVLYRPHRTVRRVALLLAVLAIPVMVLVACPGNPGGSGGGGTPAGSYTISVTGTAGSDMHAATVTLNVN